MEFTVQVRVSKASLPFQNGALTNGSGSCAATLAPPLERADRGGRNMYLLQVRMQTRLTAHGIRLLHDDTPADAESMRVALMALSAVPVAYNRRRWAVLGDLEGFGTDDTADYQAIGRFCAEHYIDRVVSVGSMAMHYAAGAIEQGLDEEHVHTFRAPAQAVPFLFEMVRAGDVLLIKGADGMEEVLEGMATV
jgi:UDP-N-acetylmuramyl pentapeptide synthase